MRITVFLMILGIMQVYANDAYSQKTRLSLNFSETELVKILDKIESESELYFLYNEKLLDVNRKVSITAKDQLISKILDDLFVGTDVKYTIIDRKIILAPGYMTGVPQQQKYKVTGTVIDAANGETLVGATISVEGTTTGTVSDAKGKFSIEVPDMNVVLVVSYIGYTSVKIVFTGQSTLEIKLVPDVKTLDQIVVIGYGTAKKRDLTGSIATVEANVLTRQTVQNAAQALQGKVAGVQITNTGGPGSSPQVRIRGLGTVTDGSNPLYVVDNVIVNDVSFLGPNDIESITILKDASSASIYGVRAAGGVIMITTKKGVDAAPSVSFNSYVGLKKAAHLVEIANGPEYIQLFNEKMEYKGDPTRLDPTKYTSHNYYDDILNNEGITNSQNLTISGGSSTAKYSIGLSHLTDNGLIQDDKYDRISFRTKYDVNIGKHLRTGFTTIITSAKSNPQSTYYMFRAHQVVPIFAPKDSLGEWTDPTSIFNDINVAAAQYYNKHTYQTAISAVLNGYVEADFLKDFSAKTSFSLNPSETGFIQYIPIYKVSSYQANPKNTLNKNRSQSVNMFWDNTLTYTKTIAFDHHLKVMAGMSYQEQQWNNLSAHAEGLQDLPEISPSYLFLSMPRVVGKYGSSVSDDGDKDVAVSYLGRLSYDYKNKYLLNAAFRNDISSKFPVQNRSGLFPSVGLGWVVTSEEFMKNVKIDFLKVRANWGLMGNGKIPSNIYVPTITIDNYMATIFGPGQNTGTGDIAYPATVTTLYNPDLKWEVVSEFDIGIEMKLFNERLSSTIEFYKRDTKDAVFPVTNLSSSGLSGSGVWGNNATITNKGIEISLGWNDGNDDFNYSVSGNITLNKNEVTELASSSAGGIYGKLFGFPATYTFSTLGHPVGEFYGLQAIGVFQDTNQVNATPHISGAIPGDLIFKDINGDGEIDDRDREFLGNPNPPVYYGLDVSCFYKGFDLSLSLQGVAGNKIANALSMYRYSTENYDKVMVDNRWHGAGTSDKFPSAALSNAQTFSSFYVESGNYLRIKNIQLGYSLPENLLSKVRISKIRIYLSGENIHTFTKYTGFSPEVTGGGIMGGVDLAAYPLSSVYSLGINLNF